MTTILLIRHGESTWNAERRYQGWADAPLSALGELQARDAAEALRAFDFDAAAASDLERARRTAEIVCQAMAVLPIDVFEELRERDLGEWSGLTREQIELRWPGTRESSSVADAPGAETREAFERRVVAGIRRVRELGDTIVVVTHGGVIRALERSAGAEATQYGNLQGRWFELVDDGIEPRARVTLLEPAERTRSETQ